MVVPGVALASCTHTGPLKLPPFGVMVGVAACGITLNVALVTPVRPLLAAVRV